MAFVKSKFSHGTTARMLEVRRFPLRKVVGSVKVHLGSGYEIERELLECGHHGRALASIDEPGNMFAPRAAKRRRCHKCARGE